MPQAAVRSAERGGQQEHQQVLPEPQLLVPPARDGSLSTRSTWDPEVVRWRRGSPRSRPRRHRRRSPRAAGRERRRQVDAREDPRGRLRGRRGHDRDRRREPPDARSRRRPQARHPDDLPGARGGPRSEVAENVMLGQWPSWRGIVRRRALRATAGRILDEIGVELDLDAPVSSLRVAERQVIEIARALLGRGPLPDPRRADRGALPPGGRAPLRVHPAPARARRRDHLHHAPPRRGHRASPTACRSCATAPRCSKGRVSDYRATSWSTAMVGKSVADDRAARAARDGGRRSRCCTFEGATCSEAFADLDLTVGDGEVVGLYGKIGSGTAEVAEVAFGLRQLTGGALHIAPGGGAFENAGAGRSRGQVGLPAGRPAARRRVHGALRRRRTSAHRRGRGWPVRAR